MRRRVRFDDLFALFDVSRLGACMADADGTVAYWNRAAERIVGLSAREVVGRPCTEVISPLPHDACEAGGAGATHQHLAGLAGSAGAQFPTGPCSVLSAAGIHEHVTMALAVAPDRPGAGSMVIYLFEDSTAPAPAAERGDALSASTAPMAHRQLADAAPDDSKEASPLSDRETEILRLSAGGATTEQIAVDLSLSVYTVRNHVRTLRLKLKAKNMIQAVTTAMNNGWL